MPADIARDTAAAARSIALRATLNMGAQAVWTEGGGALRYREPMVHPWPRQVQIETEFMASDLAALAGLRAAALASPDEPHRAYVFGCPLDSPGIAAAGYEACWNMPLLGLDLAGAHETPVAGLRIETVETRAQVDELNGLDPDYPSYANPLGSADFIDLLGRCEGRAVAKGQVVMATAPIVYVADMFTADAARGRGFGRAILYRLHAVAAARGATRSVLFPSRMAAESGFYAHAGYETACPCAVLLSRPPAT